MQTMSDLPELPPIPDIRVPGARAPRPLVIVGRTLELTLIPALATLLALAVYDGFAPLGSMPPPPTILSAGIAVGGLQYLRTRDWLTTVLLGLLASLIAWTMTLAVGLTLLFFEALECLGANGGCIPW